MQYELSEEEFITKAMNFSHEGMVLSEPCIYGLVNYIYHKKPTGGFLNCVLQNDLINAVSRADDFNRKNLAAYVVFMYNNVPSVCWGSVERVQQWLNTK